jgi:hypothetical protein
MWNFTDVDDNDDEILARIKASMDRCRAEGDACEAASKGLLASALTANANVVALSGGRSDVLRSTSGIKAYLLEKMVDIEADIVETSFRRMMSSVSLSPLQVQSDGYTISAKPLGPPIPTWSGARNGPSRPDCFWLDTLWSASFPGRTDYLTRIRFELMLKFDADSGVNGLVEVSSARFFDQNDDQIDILQLLSVAQAASARAEMLKAIHQALAAIEVPLGGLPVASVGLNFSPYSYVLGSSLAIVGANLPTHWSSIAIKAMVPDGYDKAFRVKHENLQWILENDIGPLLNVEGGQLFLSGLQTE